VNEVAATQMLPKARAVTGPKVLEAGIGVGVCRGEVSTPKKTFQQQLIIARWLHTDTGWHGDSADLILNEKLWWESHSQLGEVIEFPIGGMRAPTMQAGCQANNISRCANSTNQPSNLSQLDLKTMATTFPNWGDADALNARLATVHSALHTAASKPRVMFFHCSCGCDRTGEFYASYAMRYLNKTFTEAMTFDVKLIGRQISYANMVMSQWYCEYLAASDQYGHDSDCGNCEPFRCKSDHQYA